MKTLFLVGNVLFSVPDLIWQPPYQFALQLNFNDNRRRALSYDLVPYIPILADLRASEKSSEVNFNLLSSADWDLINPFLPLVKAIRVAPKEPGPDYFYGSLDTYLDRKDLRNIKTDYMAILFLSMKSCLNLKALLRVLQVAYFLGIQEIQDLSKFVILKKIEELDQFESFVHQIHTLPLNIQQDMSDSIYFYESRETKTSKVKHYGSRKYKAEIKSKWEDHTYNGELYLRSTYNLDNILLKIKEVVINDYPPRSYQVFCTEYHTPQIQLFDAPPGNLTLLQMIFLRHIKKKWQYINLKESKSNDCWDTNVFQCLGEKNYPVHFRVINPKYHIQVCKHTYPHALEIYNSLNPQNSSFLKKTTTTTNCALCTVELSHKNIIKPMLLLGLVTSSSYAYYKYFSEK